MFMPSILCSNLTWSTPDGQAVLSGLDLRFHNERAALVGRNGVGKTTLLRLIAGDQAPTSGSVTVNGTVARLRQAVQFGADQRIADLWEVADAIDLLRQAEIGDATADQLAKADWTLETRMAAALDRVGLDAGPDTLLRSLSGGQRTRAALAGAILDTPDFLLLDEPTNNLDRAGRAAVADLVSGWHAGLILVSHDRELLEQVDAIVELSGLGAQRYGGNWTDYRARKAVELAAAAQELDSSERQVKQAARKAQVATERQQRRDAAGARKGARGDMPRILIGARKNQAEASSAASRQIAERLRDAAEEQARAARDRVEIVEPIRLDLPSTRLAPGRTILRLDHVTVGHDPERPLLCDFSLLVEGPERIAIAGPNGSGKTSLLDTIAGTLPPLAGHVLRPVPHAMLDQTVALLDPDHSIADNCARLHPELDDNACRALLAAFRFRGDAALQRVGALSGGQMLRAGLACVLGSAPPPLLILDEPTNHLDLDAIEAVEAGLRGYDGALLVVSHDERFLDAIGITRRITLLPPNQASGSGDRSIARPQFS
ncbi:ABC-F family ATP-binding cassette domain-containing protein [Sphingobium sp. AP49]|uniref:ABC-F family ATP-binding cassette domain-containing protein n=1 Tax=Sphingobium sp. AP49 TaxID=1144307 RepID=UPI00026ED8E2|nr:ABC-F family ATP-binding cassette domain-containing protein [Sphingobium sp. AP49]WHO37293.1 ABC-F family ATP-binding cassette domain-containing protein [Sphingobium sp. AP49]